MSNGHQQYMSLFGATLMNINLMVGASAFAAPGMMAQYAGMASFYGWIFAGLLFLPVVWCIAQITTYFPEQGSFYSYSKNTISSSAGFISGWVYFLGYISIGALQLMSLMRIIAHSFNLPAASFSHALWGSLLVVALGALSARSVGLIDKIQSAATLYKLLPLFIAIVTLVCYFSPSQTPSIFTTSPLTLIPTIPIAVFGFWGFEGVCNITHLIRDSRRNASRVIFAGFIATILIYTLFHLSLLSIMGPEALMQNGAAGFVNYLGIATPSIVSLLNALVMSAIIVAHVNAIFGGIVANSAMLCTMAEEKILFLSSFFAQRVEGSNRPWGAILAHCLGLVFCISFIANMAVLNAMANIGLLIAFALTIVGLCKIAGKNILTGLACALGLVSCAILIYYSWQGMASTDAARFAALVPMNEAIFAGFIMYKIAQYNSRKAA